MTSSADLVGRELAGFRLEERLEAGGTATVYRGVNLLDDGIVRAIKVVHSELASDEVFARRFAEEARILEHLEHPNVVRFHGARRDAGLLFMELELLEGRPLSSLLPTDGSVRLPVEQVVGWIAQASEGVAAAHDVGIVHRDIKPSNLFLTASGVVKVLDFGIARALDEADRASSLTRTGTVPGTPAYLAPEVCRKGTPSRSSDVYAMGVTLLELLAGYHPLIPPGGPRRSSTELMLAQVSEDLPPLGQLRPDAPPHLERVVTRATAKEPAVRYSSARELADALAGRVTPEPQPELPSPPAPLVVAAPDATVKGGRGPRAWSLAGVAVALLLAAGLVTLVLRQGSVGGSEVSSAKPGPVRPPAPAAVDPMVSVGAGVKGAPATCILSLEGGEIRQAPAPCRFKVPAGRRVRLELRSGGYRLFEEQWTARRDRAVAMEWKKPTDGRGPQGATARGTETGSGDPSRPPARGSKAAPGGRVAGPGKRRPRRRGPGKKTTPLKDDIVVDP